MNEEIEIHQSAELPGLKPTEHPPLKVSWRTFYDNRFLREKLISTYDAFFYGVYHGQRSYLRDKINRKVEFMKLPRWVKTCVRVVTGVGVKFYNLLFHPFRKMLFKMMLMDRVLIDQMVDTYERTINVTMPKIQSLERDVHFLTQPAISGQPYLEFEQLYRGSSELLEQKMSEYVTYLKSQQDWSKQNLILDVGCGRGEFLKLAKESLGVQVLGIDLNGYLEASLKKQGIPFQRQDAFEFLENVRERFDVVACFHLIEHLPKARLPFFLQYCVKALKLGGYLILEWPNVTTLSVSGDTFELDPTHIARPHPLYIRALFNWYGMQVEQDLDLSPHEEFKHWENEPKDSREYKLAYKIFGSQDKGFIAKKVDSKRL